MAKRKYLDDVTTLASAINPELANVVLPNQGTIKADDRSWIRRVTDELAGSVKEQVQGKKPVSPYLAYPIAGAIASSLMNPLNAIGLFARGAVLGEGVNAANKALTGKSFGETTGNLLDINPEVADYLNPGYLAAGRAEIFDNLLDRGFNRLLQKVNTPKGLTGKINLALGNKNVLGLDYTPINQKKNKLWKQCFFTYF